MEVTVRIPKLPRKRAKTPGSDVHPKFSRAVSTALQHPPETRSVLIDLSKPGWLTPVEIVTLACLGRRLASKGLDCTLTLPTSDSGSIREMLYSIGLPQSLTDAPNKYLWQKKIKLRNAAPFEETANLRASDRSTLPVQWLDTDSFAITNPATNLFREEPIFDSRYAAFVTRILRSHDFIHDDAIEDFVRGILRELGWNAVIHSHPGTHWGFGAFAGQISTKTKTLSFALADLGCGVAANLRPNFLSAVSAHRISSRLAPPNLSEVSAIVRYAFEADATSRTEFPSQHDLFNKRGLSLVSDIVRERGSLSFVSSGAAIGVDKKSGPNEFHAVDTKENCPGTLVIGEIAASASPMRNARPDPETIRPAALPEFEVISIAAVLAEFRTKRLSELQQHLDALSITADSVLLDFGFLDEGSRFVENCIAIVAKTIEPKLMRAINIRASRVSPANIANVLKKNGVSTKSALEIEVRDDRYSKSTIDTSVRTGAATPKLTYSPQSQDERARLQYLANSSFLDRGLATLDAATGFYKGNIHLPSTILVDSYFSLVAHTQASNADLSARWQTSFLSLLELAASDYVDSTPVVLG